MKMATLESIAAKRALSLWRTAFRKERYYVRSGNVPSPLTIENCAAIAAGATELKIGSTPATVSGDTLTLGGTEHALLQGMFPPVPVTMSVHHDSQHMDVGTILSELEVATGIESSRWFITVDATGRAEATVSPSAAYVADEIRLRPVTDYTSVAEWLIKYRVTASSAQIREVFGPIIASMVAGVSYGDASVMSDFYAPVSVYLHGKRATRTVNATGVTTLSSLLANFSDRAWYLHGMRLLPFSDVPLWRCCTHTNTVLHLYDHQYATARTTRETLFGLVSVPAGVRGFVPHSNVTGNLLADSNVTRAAEVAAAAPSKLHACWLTLVNAGDPSACVDRGILLVDTIKKRYGFAASAAAVSAMLPRAHVSLFAELLRTATPLEATRRLRRRYVCYLQCIKDLLNGTHEAAPLAMVYAGRAFHVSPTMQWRQLTDNAPAGRRVVLVFPTGPQASLALHREGMILEELRSDRIEIALEPLKKRKRA